MHNNNDHELSPFANLVRQIPVQRLDFQTAATLGRSAEYYAFQIQRGYFGDRFVLFIHPYLTAQDFATICSALCEDRHIRFLVFNEVSLRDTGVAHICKLILSPTLPLESIDLSNNEITPWGAEVIDKALSKRSAQGRPPITINLSGNPCMELQEDQQNQQTDGPVRRRKVL